MKREIFISGDGSSSFFVPELDEHFHSAFGAYRESEHVYIKSALQMFVEQKKKINVLEIGLGTGLDAVLTFLEAEKHGLEIFYHGVEAFPLNEEEVAALNFADVLSDERISDLLKFIHSSNHNHNSVYNNNFCFFYDETFIEKMNIEEDFYDVVYFDAFSPGVQPELWTLEVFSKIYNSMRKNAVLSTYCVKGSVRRTMKECGFFVEKLPGIGTKREITRAIKL